MKASPTVGTFGRSRSALTAVVALAAAVQMLGPVAVARGEDSGSTASPASAATPGTYIEGGGRSCASPTYSTIAAAVAAAASGDRIHICPGRYAEPEIIVTTNNLTFVGDGTDRGQTRVDGENVGNFRLSAHRIFRAVGVTISFEHLTLQNAMPQDDHLGGGAVLAEHVNATDTEFFTNLGSIDGSAEGGAINAATATIVDSLFTGNNASGLGGGILLDGLGASSISGSTFVTNRSWDVGGGAVAATGPLTVSDSIFIGNYSSSGGGAIRANDLSIDTSRFEHNQANDAGGAVHSNGVLSVADSFFFMNEAMNGYPGGAIRAHGALSVLRSTFEANLAGVGGAIRSSASGSLDPITTDPIADVAVVNSTFYGNSSGANPAVSAVGVVDLSFTTLVHNTSTEPEGSTALDDTPNAVVAALDALTLTNSLVAENWSQADQVAKKVALGCAILISAVDSSGTVSDVGNCANGTATSNVSLGDYGYHDAGLTKTVSVNPWSGAIDVDTSCNGTSPSTDQNGGPRRQGVGCDAGAYETPQYTGQRHYCPRDGMTDQVGVDVTSGHPICQRVFYSSGPFTVPNDVTSVDVVLVGGGGGGGGGGTDANGALLGGGGGAGGGVSLFDDQAVTAGGSVYVSVGYGGVGGSAGSTTGPWVGTDGGAGTSSSFGTLTQAGGEGGLAGGFDSTDYVIGTGGATPGAASGAADGSAAHYGGSSTTHQAWDTSYWFGAAGGGAGAGGAGTSGRYGVIAGVAAGVNGGAGGTGYVPSKSGSLFANAMWAAWLDGTSAHAGEALWNHWSSARVTDLGLAPGGGGGASGADNNDTYDSDCGTGLLLAGVDGHHAYISGTETGEGGTVAGGPDQGVLNSYGPPVYAYCSPGTARTFGSGGGGGIGTMWTQSGTGNDGVVVIRYVAGVLPECDATTSTSSTVSASVSEVFVTGDCAWTPPAGITSVDLVVIGGGGGGADTNFGAGGGGGGGEVALCASLAVSSAIPVSFLPGAPGGRDSGSSLVGSNGGTTRVQIESDECLGRGGSGGQPGNGWQDPDNIGSSGSGGASGDSDGVARIGGTGDVSAVDMSSHGLFDDAVYGAAGGGGGSTHGSGSNVSCDKGSWDGSFTIWTPPSLPVNCTLSAGADGPEIASLSGASSSLFVGDTRVYGGGGAGGNTTGVSTGGRGGGGDGGSAAVDAYAAGGDATDIGGGGGGYSGNSMQDCTYYSTICDDSFVGPRGGAAAGNGFHGGVIVRYTTSESESLHVCVDKLYVVYGTKEYSPKSFLCVPIPECVTSAPAPSNDPDCAAAVETESAPLPSDGYSTLSGQQVLSSGLVGDLSEVPAADETTNPGVIEPMHYEHGTPDGWRKASPDEFPGVAAPTCRAVGYYQGHPVTEAGSPLEITCDGGEPGDYVFDYSFVDGLRVHPAVLTVRPKEVHVPYGWDPAGYQYVYTIKGFKLGQNASVLSHDPECTSGYPASAPWPDAGSRFDIACSNGSASNYTFKYYSSHVHVDRAKLRLSPRNRTVTYGSPAPAYGFSLAPIDALPAGGLVRLDQPELLAGYVAPVCSARYSSGTSVGTVDITCTGGGSKNFDFVPSNGTLTIVKAPLKVTPRNVSVTYGATAPSYGFDLSGYVNGDAAPGGGYKAPNCSSAYTSTTAAGTTLVVSCSGGSSTNYSFTFATAKITVNKATLTVTPSNLTVTKGANVPTYTPVVTGWVNGQKSTTAGSYVAPKCTSSYTSKSVSGTYTITCSGGSAANYQFTYRTGTVTVR